MKRQITLVEWCCLCRSVGETGFFCCCTVTLHVHYGPLFSWCLGVQWAISRTVVRLLFGWMNWFGKQSSFVWKLVSLCLLWILSRKESYTYEDLGASTEVTFLLYHCLKGYRALVSYLCTHSIVVFSDSLIIIVILIYYIL